MKGVIFTQFLTMVEEIYGEELVDKIISESDLPNDGAYTAIGTYNYEELIRLIKSLSKHTGKSIQELEIIYGKYLFNYFISHYKSLVKEPNSTFDLLKKVDGYIHVEVLKLYPEAEVPRFICQQAGEKDMVLDYKSTRPFADFAEGLMLGCAEHFGEKISIKRESIAQNDTNIIRFHIQKI